MPPSIRPASSRLISQSASVCIPPFLAPARANRNFLFPTQQHFRQSLNGFEAANSVSIHCIKKAQTFFLVLPLQELTMPIRSGSFQLLGRDLSLPNCSLL